MHHFHTNDTVYKGYWYFLLTEVTFNFKILSISRENILHVFPYF